MMIRICHLITSLEGGGTQNVLARLVAEMDRARFSSSVISLAKPGSMGTVIRAAGVPLKSLGMRSGAFDHFCAFRCLGMLRQDMPDVLQTWLYHADLLGTLAGRLAGVSRIVWNIRCSDLTPESRGVQRKILSKSLAILSQLPNAVIVNSHAGRERHQALGYCPRQWAYIPNGVDTSRFRPRRAERAELRERLGIPEGVIAIGMIARLHPMKDHGTFLAAAEILTRRGNNAIFVLAGEGCEPGALVLSSHLDARHIRRRLRLIGFRSDMEVILPALDIASLCSAYGEGFPNVLIEAMACGVPCVATDVGDCARIVGETGIIVPPRDPVALALAWEKVLARDRAALSAAVRERAVTVFGFDRVRADYEALYTDLVDPGLSAPARTIWHTKIPLMGWRSNRHADVSTRPEKDPGGTVD